MGSHILRPCSFELEGVQLTADLIGDRCDFTLLHAGGERRRVWYPVMQHLAQAGYGSIAVDQRGHGESGGSRRDGIRKYGADAAMIVSSHNSKTIVVGASLGGFSGMLASTDVQARIKIAGFVLVDVIPDPDPNRVRRFLRTTTPPLDDSPLVEDILGEAEALKSACAAIDFPVMLVLAEQSAIQMDEVARLEQLVKKLEIVRIDGASHLVARDRPTELADALIRFAQTLAAFERD